MENKECFLNEERGERREEREERGEKKRKSN